MPADIPRPSQPGCRALRRGRASIPGQVYLLTFVVDRRRPVFARPTPARVVAQTLSCPRLWKDNELLAWVLMPDHFHGLARLGDADPLNKLVNRLKSATGRQVNRVLRRDGALWQRGFHDHALRTDEDLVATARYIVANPLRAGLVSQIGDYPYWDARWLSANGHGSQVF
jgi:REP element-mobilizing transposase RayT